MTNSQNRKKIIFRSQICSSSCSKSTVNENFVFQEEKNVEIFWFKINIQKRGYYSAYYSCIYTEEQMENSVDYMVDENRVVYNRPTLNIRMANWEWLWANFVNDEAMLKMHEEIKNGKTKTIDVTNWN